ncbi:MAG: hypothetical protein KDA91_23115, partial [Planctomycetaceae bacterium]|nr:hypothetical protein [Planctomycetaceae bacterium]
MVKRKTEESKLQNRIASARQAWRKRHSPSGLQFVLADRIDLIPARAWDSLTNNHSWFLSREYLSVIDSAGPENVSGRYAMAFDGCKPVAALVAQLVQIDGKHLISNDPVVAKTTALIEPGAKSIAEFTAVARKKVE